MPTRRSALFKIKPIKPIGGTKKPSTGLFKPPKGLKKFPGSSNSASEDRDSELGPPDPEVVNMIEEALRDKTMLGAVYLGEEGDASYRTFFPLALGSWEGSPRLYTAQYSGDTGQGPRCFRVAALRDVEIITQEWPSDLVAVASEKCMRFEEGVKLAGEG